ncbi:hypothetical protein TBLA_0I03080 [Henningerozyma blattae CBS 6284]|uniref:Gag1-like clamp domain-containing protein n=1 Tax=Henningerozyma blattae (strain ATCC 34711 / CBS 6284 / DSM 70876 / NBRC 10599 / NRRL Y-10934 / UCD 77-7) TaxID=1071380 RepID=I2H9B1_HENB6|nr:hypothetical protein TBLA_0I03080 [Tetrapisispora blattae CBS 6284]CCH62963.1 hypothetical protein TBLA_0I03080 [Tetrapisispora blattae CBS 6284]
MGFFRKVSHHTLEELDEKQSNTLESKQVDALFLPSGTTSPNISKTNTSNKQKSIRNLKFKKSSLSIKTNNTSLSTNQQTRLEMNSSNDNTTSNTTMTSHSNKSLNIPNSKNNTYLNVNPFLLNYTTNSNGNDDRDDDRDDDDDTTHYTNSLTFATYDSVKESRKLRKESEKNGVPFINANEVWIKRRNLWTTKSSNCIDSEVLEKRNKVFETIPPGYYSRVYKKLVVDDKPLLEPLNLQNAIRVIDAGWTETKKWDNASKGLC